MSSLHAVLPQWAAMAWLPLVLLAGRSLHHVLREAPLRGGQQHLWLAGIVLIAWLWTMQTRLAAGVGFGLLGVACYALIFGRHRARLGLLAALALHALLGGGSWLNFGVNGLALAVLPTLLVATLQRQIEQRLPKNVFVFIIGNGLFVTLAVTAATSVLLVLGGWSLRPAAGTPLDQLAYALLLAWGEALATGMLFSALVIFVPHLVLTYRQDLYLPPWRGL